MAYHFQIKTAFYQQIWFALLVCLLLVAAVIGIPRLLKKIAIYKENKYKKYKSSTLTFVESRRCLMRLIKIMKEEKPYLDPDLSQQKLAEKLSISKENLSQILHEQLRTNLKNFLNQHRIEAAKRKLADPGEADQKLLKIAYDSGFNSKSVFNDAFRKFTGMSPSDFRKKQQRR